MKKLVLALALTMASQAQAETSLDDCREAINDIGTMYAFDSVCGGQNANYHLNNNMGVFSLKGCNKKVSLNEVKKVLSFKVGVMSDHKYQEGMTFCNTAAELNYDAMNHFVKIR